MNEDEYKNKNMNKNSVDVSIDCQHLVAARMERLLRRGWFLLLLMLTNFGCNGLDRSGPDQQDQQLVGGGR